jgi:hypothetical protein
MLLSQSGQLGRVLFLGVKISRGEVAKCSSGLVI